MQIKDFLTYIKSERRYSFYTFTSYRRDLFQFQQFLKTKFEVSNDNEIRFEMIRSWVALLLDSKNSVSTVNRKISTLRSYFKYLISFDIIKKNPITKLIAPKTNKKIPSHISQIDMSKILDETNFTDDFIGKRNFLIIEFLYLTGVRVSELLSIRIKDFDFKNKSVKIIGKGKKERFIPLADVLIKRIQIFVQKFNIAGYLFTNDKNKRLYSKKIYRIVKDHLSSCSTKTNNSPHILRHTFATHMLDNGADINAIKELLGHSSLNATQVYTHNSIEKVKSIYKKAHPRA
ncbi:tyrosine-type recombinase/integrase [Bacteroidota bacterium]|nr:tyrosine-type recombinase/integrase [Bacteroidota bacterium]